MNFSGEPQKKARRILRWVWIHLLYGSGLLRWARHRIIASSGIVVLTLHRVLPDSDFRRTPSPDGMLVRERTFEQFLSYLQKECDVLAAIRVPERWEKRNRPAVVITFDDGWQDTWQVAFPILKKFGFRMAVFVCPGLMGKSWPFWPEQVSRAWRRAATSTASSERFKTICSGAPLHRMFFPASDTLDSLEELISDLKRLPSAARDAIIKLLGGAAGESLSPQSASEFEATMSWEAARSIKAERCWIGSHTCQHEILPLLPVEDARREIADSKKAIEVQLCGTCDWFAYPNGSWSESVRDLVLMEGYELAFINEAGLWTKETDPWLIPRVNIWEGSLTDPSDNFSPIVVQYALFWRVYWAEAKKKRQRHPSGQVSPFQKHLG